MDKARTNPESIRGRLERALSGQPIERPVYAVYDWFVQNRPIDWPRLFQQGLGQIRHAPLVDIVRPHLEIVETTTPTERGMRRDVRWITDRGELHEWYLGDGLGWRQEYLVKRPADYRIVQRAFEDSSFRATDDAFHRMEAEIGEAASRWERSGARRSITCRSIWRDSSGSRSTWPTKRPS